MERGVRDDRARGVSIYCPRDSKVCIDDLCYGGSCLMMAGVAPGERCDGCGVVVFRDIEDCRCELDDEYPDDDHDVECPECDGEGFIGANPCAPPCPVCDGHGSIEATTPNYDADDGTEGGG